MSDTELQFRTATFGGFNKQDVLAYLESTARSHAEQQEAQRKELAAAQAAQAAQAEECAAAVRRAEELAQENARLAGELAASAKDLEDARADRDARDRRLADLDRELGELRAHLARIAPAAESYERIKNRTAGVELEAHRRAQEIEDDARDKSRQARAELEQWIYQVQAGYDRLRTDVDATIAHASGELERVRKSLDGLMGQFDEGDAALAALLHTYQSAMGPAVPEPLPLKEEET